MSTTTTPATPTTTAIRDRAIAASRDLPQLVSNLSTADPALAAQLTGKALLATKSPIGTLASGVVGWLVAHYGLGWDQGTCDLVAGAAILVGGYVMRYITTSPITGFLKAKLPLPSAPTS